MRSQEIGDIERDVPLPERGAKTKAKYPFAKMKIGDSFLVRAPGGYCSALSSRVGQAANYRAKAYPGERYTTRRVPGGLRVWRIDGRSQR